MNWQNIKHGIAGGLIGGVLFGFMLLDMLPMIGQMVGLPHALSGYFVHLGISASIGASFAVLFGSRIRGIGTGVRDGLIYGAVWWFLGPLTLMPLFSGMGLGVNWNVGAAVAMIGGLVGHLLFGAILGAVYAWLRGRTASVPAVGTAGATAQN